MRIKNIIKILLFSVCAFWLAGSAVAEVMVEDSISAFYSGAYLENDVYANYADIVPMGSIGGGGESGGRYFNEVSFTYQIDDSLLDLIIPKIISLKLNDTIVVTGDYLTALPVLDVIATDNKAIDSYRIEVLDAKQFSLDEQDTGLVTIPAASFVTLNTPIQESLNDGQYHVRISVFDTAGNVARFMTSLFNVREQGFVCTSIIAAPNPFNPRKHEVSHIGFQLNKDAKVELYIYSISGRLIYKDQTQAAIGYSEFIWNGRDRWEDEVPNGGYLAYLVFDDGEKQKTKLLKIAVLR